MPTPPIDDDDDNSCNDSLQRTDAHKLKQ